MIGKYSFLMIEACFLYKSLYTSLCIFEHNLAHREGIQIFGLLFDLRISLSVLLLFSGRQILFLTRKPRQLSGEFFSHYFFKWVLSASNRS